MVGNTAPKVNVIPNMKPSRHSTLNTGKKSATAITPKKIYDGAAE